MATATSLFRCRKCGECVFDSSCVVTVHGQQHPVSDGSTMLPMNSSCRDVTMATVWYITDESAPAWILKTVESAFWSKGKLLCPKCGGRLGSFDFTKTMKCACGESTAPPIHISQCRVDLRTSPAAIQTLSGKRGDNIAADPSKYSEKNKQISSNAEEGFNLDISTSLGHEKTENIDRSYDLIFDPDLASTVDLRSCCSEKTSAVSFGKANPDTFPHGADRSFRESDLKGENGRSVLDANYNSKLTSERTGSFERGRTDIDISLPESDVHLNFVPNKSKADRKSEMMKVMENFFKGDNQQMTGNQQESLGQGHDTIPEGQKYRDFTEDGFMTEQLESPHFSERPQFKRPSRTEQPEHPCPSTTKQLDRPCPRRTEQPEQPFPITMKQSEHPRPSTMEQIDGRCPSTMGQIDGSSPSTTGQSQQHSCDSRTEQSEPSIGDESDYLHSDNVGGGNGRNSGSPENSKQRRRCRRGKCNNVALSTDTDQENEVVDPVYPEEHLCPLCLDLYCHPMRTSPCNHVFCDTCLRRLAQNKPVNTPCPLCRQVITKCHGDDGFAKELKTLYSSLYKKRQATEHRFRNNSYHKLPEVNSSTLRLHYTGQNPRQPARARNNNWMGIMMMELAVRYVLICFLVLAYVIRRACRHYSKITIVMGLILLAFLTLLTLYVTVYTVKLIGSVSQPICQAIVEFLGGLVLSPQVEFFQSESTKSLLPTSVRIRALTANFFLIVIVVLICRYVFFRRVMIQLRRNV
ncbi:uncharacterized protein LOC117315705 isoform X1 [Pecten maximus]|uniref:uncharacterized protein LOC117315705 isoform X1 n=1 Tax=Pecten maximus TaxID=6579 RepID=UPI0014582939|nr:uncharacterized protein LOC117315705 isoform X1 [Pecten maximus]XP_033725923.1 uncharacterized protein LOC117315705 isoform X1 [Pecten maximus]XP_033725925.1 uncharacterized protein LOC117315705 isoform X1 [Pecten maximus]XP_033725926.1 uncharacterized protein LOC117315705 isoform X1 [Pecten maximus]XP_033725927.1 uncharacterized protein LOC117315705 isoform X1 [Pecten maximus]XP_033725928.1 uncharacterized protein LOC117315705 isoform X1 [Pecten maximus]XP_033725929.1 uncharacterized prot